MQPDAGSTAASRARLPALPDGNPFAVADSYRRAALSGATMAAYRTDWSHFAGWCTAASHNPLPADPAVVGAYLAQLGHAGSSASTLGRRVAAINKVHQWSGHPRPGTDPAVTLVLEGFRRSTQRPVRRMAPLLLADLKRMLSMLDTDSSPHGALGRRDRVLLLFGWGLACRRGELAALRVADVTPATGGLAVRIRRSKTDQRGRGLTKALPIGRTPLTCSVCAYCDWRRLCDAADRRGRVGVLAALERPVASTDHDHDLDADDDLDADRPVLRGVRAGGHLTGVITGHAVNLVVKRRLPGDLDPARFGAHSLRAGFITEAARRGATGREIRRQTGQSSDRVVEIYIRENDPLTGNAVTTVGL